ncbi:hypothetical protein [Candidatus Lokiarchaeum ossiferum]|uniref:hypothetical protein n=1 Tax=Candidatus Lokiarchaeum ossiferum TaxID=2951803 RepID=UPI00352EB998
MSVTDKFISLPNKSPKCTFSLENFPGIGKKIREKLLNYYSNENDALKAIQVGAVGCVPGISFKQALKFAQTYFELTEEVSLIDVLVTPDITEIYDNVIGHIEKYARTNYSKLKLRLYFPLPSHKIQLIKERQQYFYKSIQFVQKHSQNLKERGFSKLLSALDNLKQGEDFPKIRSRIIITDSQKVENFLVEEDIISSIVFEKINFSKITDNLKFFQNYSRNFDVVIYCGDHSEKIPAFSNLITIPSKNMSIETLVPEKIIRIFGFNKNIIQSMIRIVVNLKNLKEEKLINHFLSHFDIKKIRTLKENTSILDEKGEILSKIDSTLDEFRAIADEFSSLVGETESWINDQIQSEIGQRSIQIQGKQILDLIRTDLSIEQVRNYIPVEVDELIEETIHKGLETLCKQLHLGKQDQDLTLNLIPEIIEFPIQLNTQECDVLEKKISARLNTHKYSVMVKIASQLSETYEYLLQLHQILLEFDFFYTIGTFAHQFGLSIPQILEKQYGFFGTNLTNLELKSEKISNQDSKKNDPEPIPITYQLGSCTDSKIPEITPATLCLLTGSNSGGKTMCINTCSQAIILAQMGFPSLGDLKFHPFDELYYYKKSSGQLSAGAFETTLLQFVQLAQSPKLKIVFADELESITEPNAASKVLSGIFSLLLQNPNNFGIFVTHLAELLQTNFTAKQKNSIRIDGIEATGLDKNLHLIVDRNPRFNYVAKSTPELILTRLAKSGSKEQQLFFSTILKLFNH